MHAHFKLIFFNPLVWDLAPINSGPLSKFHFSNLLTKMKTSGCCFPLDLYSLSVYSLLADLISLSNQESDGGEEVGVIFHWIFLSKKVIVISAALSCLKTKVCYSLFICHPDIFFNSKIVCGIHTSSIKSVM